jgi:hypothetical protein
MKDKPILFSGPMVRAILDGRKTMTRRTVKPQPPAGSKVWRGQDGLWRWATNQSDTPIAWDGTPDTGLIPCPYGPVGRRLWVKETWSPDHRAFYPHFPVVYRVDNPIHDSEIEGGKVYSPEAKEWFQFRWRPSIHMPRWASRITLEVTGVRCERVQEISEEDAECEGCPECPDCQGVNWSRWGRGARDDALSNAAGGMPWSTCFGACEGKSAKEWFAELWQSINGPGSWEANPWVWVVEFRRLP